MNSYAIQLGVCAYIVTHPVTRAFFRYAVNYPGGWVDKIVARMIWPAYRWGFSKLDGSENNSTTKGKS